MTGQVGMDRRPAELPPATFAGAIGYSVRSVWANLPPVGGRKTVPTYLKFGIASVVLALG